MITLRSLEPHPPAPRQLVLAFMAGLSMAAGLSVVAGMYLDELMAEMAPE
jgi:hypothetical protein